jgi:ubiquinol-cytochrome c reductase cytochrome c subunit
VRFLNRSLNKGAGRLSRHRRGPVAGFLVMMIGLLLTGGLYAAFAPASAEQQQTNTEQVAQGRQLFLVGCAFCHGQNGEGMLTQDGTQELGPTLIGVGSAAVDFQLGTGRMPAVQPGAQFPAKKTSYNDDEIAAIAAYIASLGPGPAIPAEGDYSTEGMTEEQKQEAVVRGGQIFLTNCTACHNFGGNGGAMPEGKSAPPLHNTSAKHLYEAMLTGPGEMDVFSNGNLSPEEKRDVILYLQSIKDAPEYGGFSMGGLGPVSEGLFAWVAGIGVLVGFAVWIAAHTTRSDKTKNPDEVEV